MNRHRAATARRPRRKGVLGVRALLAALLLGSIPLLAPTPASAQALVVRVRDVAKGIGDATVTILYRGNVLDHVVTDADGIARASGIPAGTYQLRVEALGHAPNIPSKAP